MSKKSKKIGLITATSLVVGNMIGAGIFLLPASLAQYGSISLIGWFFTATGAIVLAKIFSNLSKILENKSGGPYAYSREGFGDFIGFLVAWGYWISIWVSNAGLAIAIVGALSVFFPELKTNSSLAIIVGLSMIWLFTWINSRGIKKSGNVQVVTTILKLIPLVFVIFLGVFFFDLDNFPDFNLTSGSHIATFPVVAALTLYAFLGVESATIPAENVKNPKKNIPIATMLGTIIVTVIYVASTIVLFGLLPHDVLGNSPAPFAEGAKIIAGNWAEYFVAFGAVVSGVGALNGWILLVGQLPLAAAKDQMFPKIFKVENKKGAPFLGLLVGGALTSFVMMLNFTDGLVDQFTFVVNLTVLTCLIPYLFVSASYILILIEKKIHLHSFVKTFGLGLMGVLYSIWAIYGSGAESVFYGFILLLLAVPLYLIMNWNKTKK